MPSTPIDNAAIAATLDEYAALLELADASSYSTRAYRRAAELIRGLPVPVEELVRAGRVRDLRGVGRSIEARLRELVESGRIVELDELRRQASPERVEALARRRRRSRRPILLHRARAVTEGIAEALGGIPAGDPRRWKDASMRLADVVVSQRPDEARARFAALPEIVSVLDGDVGITAEGISIELVSSSPDDLGTALIRATGSAEYVEALGPLPDAPDEEQVYRLLGRPYVPPELREVNAPSGSQKLVEVSDLRGDVHCHTVWSDGKATVLEMAEAARDRGYEYIAICDHTVSVRVVTGLEADDVRRQAAEIHSANELLAPFRVLRGIECDILPDGSLDLPDDVLAELDWVQLSLHAGQRTPRAELTARVTHAMRHPAVRSLSHPTGRLIGHRPENALDLEQTFEVAREEGVAVEVNGLPARLDLSGEHVRRAIEAGVRVTCSTDAHSVVGLDFLDLSVHTARRGGAQAVDVLNTRPLAELLSARSG
jgi:DNA polymerase (family 10)